MLTFLNLLADTVENFWRQANDTGLANLADVMARGDLELEVEFVPAHESYCGWNEATIFATFVDGERSPCWDNCDGILRFHRGGWCRTNQSHADMCACGEPDYDDYDDEIADAMAGHP